MSGMTKMVVRMERRAEKRTMLEKEDMRRLVEMAECYQRCDGVQHGGRGAVAVAREAKGTGAAGVGARAVAEDEEDARHRLQAIVDGQMRRMSHALASKRAPSSLEAAVAAVRDALGFNLSMRPSTAVANSSRRGVFIEGGGSRRGALVCLYPGVAYTYAHYISLHDSIQAGITGKDRLMARVDGTVINAQGWTTVDCSTGVAGSAAVPPAWESYDRRVARAHPLALMHHVKHPSRGQVPNIAVYNYDCLVDVGGDEYGDNDDGLGPVSFPMRRHVPTLLFGDDCTDGEIVENDGGEAAHKPSLLAWVRERLWAAPRRRSLPLFAKRMARREGGGKVAVPCVVGIATDDIAEGDELLLNYRLNPDAPRPDWYVPVDEAEDRRRWQ